MKQLRLLFLHIQKKMARSTGINGIYGSWMLGVSSACVIIVFILIDVYHFQVTLDSRIVVALLISILFSSILRMPRGLISFSIAFVALFFTYISYGMNGSITQTERFAVWTAIFFLLGTLQHIIEF